MNQLLIGVLGGCTALVGYTYAGYPALLWAFGRRRRASSIPRTGGDWPFISIVVPAYNEAEAIARTLEQLLEADYPADRRQIVVVSDASTDGTDAIVESFRHRGVELVRMSTRGGKTRNENAVLPLLRGEIIINTDASMRVHPSAIKALVTALNDSTVGVASGRDVSVPPMGEEEKGGEGSYVGYEMWVRDLETRLSGIVGASGCLYAIRADLHRGKIREDLSRDFASALTAREHGYRAVSVSEAICYVPHTSSLHQEYRRKVRTIARGLLTLGHRHHLLNPFRYGGFAWMLFSHKVCRWLVPWALGAGLVALCALAVMAPWVRWFMPGVGAVLVAAVLGWLWPEGKRAPWFLSLPAYVVAGNVAVLHAWLRALTGRRTPVWEPTRRPADPAAV